MIVEADVMTVVAIADRQRHLFRPIYNMASMGELLTVGFEAIRRELQNASPNECASVCATFAIIRSSAVHADHVSEAGRAITAEIDDPVFSRHRVLWLIAPVAPLGRDVVRDEIEASGATELYVMSTETNRPLHPNDMDLSVPIKVVPFDSIASLPAALFYDAFCDEYAYTMVHPRAKTGIQFALERFGYSHYQMLDDASKIRQRIPRYMPPVTARA